MIVGNGTAVLVGKIVGWLVTVGEAGATSVLVGGAGRLVTVSDTIAVLIGVFVGNVVGWPVAVGALRVGDAETSVAVAEAA